MMIIRLVFVACTCISIILGGGDPGVENTSLTRDDFQKILQKQFEETQAQYIEMYGPDATASLCNSSMLAAKRKEEADEACEVECKAISEVCHKGFEAYPTYYSVKKLHRECYGFTSGECKKFIYKSSPWTYCDCYGRNFRNSARYCRTLIFGVRVGSNVYTYISNGVKHYWAWNKDFIARQKKEREHYERWYQENKGLFGNEWEARTAYKEQEREKFLRREPSILTGGHGASFFKSPSSNGSGSSRSLRVESPSRSPRKGSSSGSRKKGSPSGSPKKSSPPGSPPK
nr:PREDICTED: uncharacterized protein LOC109040210 [Bemisia tabaci]